MIGTGPNATALTTYADLVWPARGGRALSLLRGAILVFAGTLLLTVSAKIQVPGPVPTTLQTLAVLALGAMLGARLAVASVLLYLAEGALGLPVFANTPPQVAGLAYLVGPTTGFLVGLAVAAGIVGRAADKGLSARPVVFGAVLAGADAALLALGWLWLAFVLPTHGQFGLGAGRALAVGITPFLLGEVVKVALAALALPLSLSALRALLGR